jgi:hypothetical protein
MADCTQFHKEEYTCDKEITTYKSWLYPENEEATSEEISAAREQAQDERYDMHSSFGYKRSDFPCTFISAERLQRTPEIGADPAPDIGNCAPYYNGCAGSLPDDKQGDYCYKINTLSYPPTLSDKVPYPQLTMERKFKFNSPKANITEILQTARERIAQYEKIINDPTGREALKHVGARYPCVDENPNGSTTYNVGNPQCTNLIRRVKAGARNSINRIKPLYDAREIVKLGILLSIPITKGSIQVSAVGKVKVLKAKESSKKIETYKTVYLCKGGDTRVCCDCDSSSSSSSSSFVPSDCIGREIQPAEFRSIVDSILFENPECCTIGWGTYCQALYCARVTSMGYSNVPNCPSSSSSSLAGVLSTETLHNYLNLVGNS